MTESSQTPGHAFVRPGQVAPDRPPRDRCVVCGEPRAVHVPVTAVDPRLTRARDALGTADLAELHQALAGLVGLVDEFPTPFEDTDDGQAARRAELAGALPPPYTADPQTIDGAVAERLAVIPDDTAHVVSQWLRAARKAEPEKLAAVRAVLAGFDWEFHDRQLALEAIERIVTGGDR